MRERGRVHWLLQKLTRGRGSTGRGSVLAGVRPGLLQDELLFVKSFGQSRSSCKRRSIGADNPMPSAKRSHDLPVGLSTSTARSSSADGPPPVEDICELPLLLYVCLILTCPCSKRCASQRARSASRAWTRGRSETNTIRLDDIVVAPSLTAVWVHAFDISAATLFPLRPLPGLSRHSRRGVPVRNRLSTRAHSGLTQSSATSVETSTKILPN